LKTKGSTREFLLLIEKIVESIIVIVGFLGAGKTRLLKDLIESYLSVGWNPYVILNDYANASFEASQLSSSLSLEMIKALNGSCICCDGIGELRQSVNSIPRREKGITLIEANGTSDACRLMGFLGVGLNKRFCPPIQISVVDVKNWQKRESNNELEISQIQISSLIVLSHVDAVSEKRLTQVENEVRKINSDASVVNKKDLKALLLPKLRVNKSSFKDSPTQIEHSKTHWASCSIDMPNLPNLKSIKEICGAIPDTILRVKGCTRLGQDKEFTYFERSPDGKVNIRPYRGKPITGPKLLTIGTGSDPVLLQELLTKFK